MALIQQKILDRVEILQLQNAIQVRWQNQIVNDETNEILSATFERKAYMQEQKAELLAEVTNGQAYVDALGWV